LVIAGDYTGSGIMFYLFGVADQNKNKAQIYNITCSTANFIQHSESNTSHFLF
jgi:hypothetical protein